jgi:hypothetical protein
MASASQRDLEISCQHPDLVALCFDKDIREDGNGIFPLDDALEKLEFSQKLILPDNKFHSFVMTSSRAVQLR